MLVNIQRWLLAGFFVLTGVWLTVGGGWLAALGGSLYYLPAGLLCLMSGGLLFARRRAGAQVYLLLLALTAVWALWEVGPHFWLLLPRIFGPALIGFWLVMPWIWRSLNPAPSRNWLPLTSYSIIVATGFAAVFIADREPEIASTAATSPVVAAGEDASQWPAFGNSPHGTRYSPATQITPANIARLKPAWTYRTGDLPGDYPGGKTPQMFQSVPIKVGDTLYACTPRDIVVALDADTGRQLWKYNPHIDATKVPMAICRGVTYYKAPAGTQDCPQRILVGTIDARMLALDASTGRPCRTFGNNGAISLLDGMGKVLPGFYYVTSPPTIIGEAAVVGGLILDNMGTDEPPGVIRAFSALTGRLMWAWDAGAREGSREWVRGSPNAWGVFSADPKLNLIYIPTGNPTPDHFGGLRTADIDRHARSVVALDGATGKLRWSFQTVHHDLWDYDIASQPVLLDMPIYGKMTPALVQPTKQGEVFLLDRRTGAPLVPIKEVPVPRGEIPGERYSPTQPVSPSFPAVGPRYIAESDMWGTSPIDQLWCRIRYRGMSYKGRFTPPALKETLEFPGNNGIMNWGSVSIDEQRKLMIVNGSYVPLVVNLIPRVKAPKTNDIVVEGPSAIFPQLGTPFAAKAVKPFLSFLGVPCTAPPWGEIAAIDLNTHKMLWKRPLGTSRDHAPFGIAVPGAFNQGGSVITAGGVVFIGAALDNYLRAFDANTGKEIWKGRLPAGGQASPITYTSKRTGKQMVVISAGGHQFMDTTIGDYIVAYALN